MQGVTASVPFMQKYGEGCLAEDIARIQKACAVDPDAQLTEQQFLFNVYIHPAPDFEGGLHVLCRPAFDPSC